MLCQGAGDDALQADKLDVLYGEADSAARARLNAHVASCDACREEMRALSGLRRHLASWRLPQASPRWSARGLVVPRWLAAAALFLLGFGATLGASGYLSLRRELAAQEARATRLEQQQREAKLRLAAAGASPQAPVGDANALLARVDERLDERIQASERQQLARLDRRFADWQERAEVRRRVDMAQVAASLSYLDGRHGEQLARTNELMGYMLQASEKR